MNNLPEINEISDQKENLPFFNQSSSLFERKRVAALEKLKASFSSNLYETLQISPGSDLAQIKRAYKKLSLKSHPDKNKGGDTEEFRKIAHAYKILGNEELRKVYDEQGLEMTEMLLNIFEGNEASFLKT